MSSSIRFSLFFLLSFAWLFQSCEDTPPRPEANIVKIRLDASATTLSPLMPSVAPTRLVGFNIYQTLGILHPGTLELQPLLVTAIPELKPVADGPHKGMMVADFQLNNAAVWDDGSPITARDVEFTLKLIFHPLLPTELWRGYFEHVKSFEIDPADPKRFSVYFDQFYLLAIESLCQIPIYPAYKFDAKNRLGKVVLNTLLNPTKTGALANDAEQQAFAEEFKSPALNTDTVGVAGSGPYRVASYSQEEVILKRKTNWWGYSQTETNSMLAAYPDQLVYRVVKDEAAAENMLRTGQLDVIPNFSAAKFVELTKDAQLSQTFAFERPGLNGFNQCMLNMLKPKFKDVRVRRALAYLIDYDYLISTVLYGMGDRIVAPVLPQKSYYAHDIKLYQLNLDSARANLTAAGWTDSDGDGLVDKVVNGKRIPMSFEMLYPLSKASEMLANSMAQTARQAGVEIKIKPLDLPSLSAETRTGNFEAALLGRQLYVGLNDFYQEYSSKSLAPAGDNRSRFSNARADSLINIIRTTADPDVRKDYYIQFQQLLHDEVPVIFLYAAPHRIIINKKFNYVLTANRAGFYENLFQLKENK